MDGLSGVASGMAVASLSIQLIESIGKIRTFVRNVKDAPKELERIVDLLERLEALLEDIRDLMERQTSLQEQHFPAPSMTIYRCLKRCEKDLQPLHETVERFTRQQQVGSTMAKFMNEFKLGSKAKDIAVFEARIQQEINYLHTALGLNSTAILINVLPMLQQNQQTILTSQSRHCQIFIPTQNSTVIATNQDDTVSSISSFPRISRQISSVQSTLERFGLYHRKVVRYRHFERGKTERGAGNYTKEVLSEDDEFSVVCKLVGYGLTWTQSRSYGRLLPSLNVYPVVWSFSDDIYYTFEKGSIREVQQMFSSGTIHPFSRDPRGFSLLHEAAFYERADICQLLSSYGVKPDLTSNGWSPLSRALNGVALTDLSGTMDTYRCFLEEKDSIEDFSEGTRVQHTLDLYYLAQGLEEARWLWQQNANVFRGEDSLMFRRMIIRGTWSYLGLNVQVCDEPGSEIRFPELAMGIDILDHIQSGRCRIFNRLFDYCEHTLYSYVLGAAFVKWLVEMGLDIETCVTNELEHLSGEILADWPRDKRIVFERGDGRGGEQDWILGFEWVFDHQAPGYLLVSEYSEFAYETDRVEAWPFCRILPYFLEFDYYREGAKWQARFNRRIAAKARKERARSGQKRPRSKMPGAWI